MRSKTMTRSTAVSDLPDLSRIYESPREALRAAITHLEIRPGVGYPRAGRAHTVAKFHRDLPYAILNTDLPGVQILVNRQYKPLGSTEREWAIYERYPNLHVRLTSSEIRRVCYRDNALFDDGCPPWRGPKEARAYLTRLRWLEEIVARANGSLPEAA
jgi:hypothetical protein